MQPRTTTTLAELNCQSFSECLNTTFELHTSGNDPWPLELCEVTEHNSSRTEQFSLTFRGPFTPYVGQGIHAVRHPKLGDLDLFLVPIGRDGQGMLYEVVFNRIRK